MTLERYTKAGKLKLPRFNKEGKRITHLDGVKFSSMLAQLGVTPRSSKLIAVRLPADLLDKIDAWAKREGVTRSDVIRHRMVESFRNLGVKK